MKLPHRSSARGRDGVSVQALSIRVALAATAVVGIAYVFISVIALVAVSNNLTAEVDQHLNQSLNLAADFRQQPGGLPDGGPAVPGFDPTHQDPRGVPVVLWVVGSDGTAIGQGYNAPALPSADTGVTAPTTASIGGVEYRVAGRSIGAVRVVVGQSLDSVSQTTSTLLVAEIGIGLALVIFVFM